MSPSTQPDTPDDLDRAASLLLAVADTEPPWEDPAVALRALSAATHLRRAGARPKPVSVPAEPAARAWAVTQALRLLAGLPRELFEHDAVLDAVRDATRAHDATG